MNASGSPTSGGAGQSLNQRKVGIRFERLAGTGPEGVEGGFESLPLQQGTNFAPNPGFGLAGKSASIDVDDAFGGHDVGLASPVDPADVDRGPTKARMGGTSGQFGGILCLES